MFRKRQNKASASAPFQKLEKDCSAKFLLQIRVGEELDIIYLLYLFKFFRVRKRSILKWIVQFLSILKYEVINFPYRIVAFY